MAPDSAFVLLQVGVWAQEIFQPGWAYLPGWASKRFVTQLIHTEIHTKLCGQLRREPGK